MLITRADKGNAMVILSINDYNDKMHEILSDVNIYRTVMKDPTNKLTTEIRTLLTRWKNKDFIDQSVYKKLYISDGDLPRSYGLPKVHKESNPPLRMIVSCINSPFFQFS